MSKSLGNFFTVRDRRDQGVPGEVIRFVMLSTHYRKPMDWTEKKREEAEKTLRKWNNPDEISSVPHGSELKPSREVVDALGNDLNTPGAIAVLHRLFNEQRFEDFVSSARWLGIPAADFEYQGRAQVASMHELDDSVTSGFIELFLTQRADAKAGKDYAKADSIRNGLIEAGVVLKDTSEGTTWEKGPNFDPAKLEALK